MGKCRSVMARAKEAGLSDLEIESGKRICQRFLHSAALRKLGRNDLVYALETCTHTRADGEGLEVNDKLSADDIRKFLDRAEKFANKLEVPNEPFEKTVPEVFRGLIDEALTVK